MAVEIERKFLVDKQKWSEADKGKGYLFRQGYILTDPAKTIRIRVTDDTGFITIKGKSVGASRPEYEYPIPKRDAQELLDNFCQSDISKLRYIVKYSDNKWEIDEFLGENEGLIVAEIELTSEQESFDVPDWIDREVTGEEKYYNSKLSLTPFKTWSGV
jgi:adenylate cyclase